MSFTERVAQWNRSYDNIPEYWRFQFVVWTLIAVGAVNMLLTVMAHFPFGLLVVLAIIVIAAIRVPYARNWVARSDANATDAKFQIEGAGWLQDVNRRYDAMPDGWRFWVYPAVLLIGAAINMMLTIAYGFPFGLLFLLVLLCLVAIRAPYAAAGWFRTGEPSVVQPYGTEVTHEPMAAIASEPTPPVAARAPDLADPVPRAPDIASQATRDPEHSHDPEHSRAPGHTHDSEDPGKNPQDPPV